MAYEYENRLKDRMLDLEFDTWEETAQFEREYRELQEVYRKARAFDEILNIEDNYFDKYDESITAEEFLCEFDFILDNHERNESADDER